MLLLALLVFRLPGSLALEEGGGLLALHQRHDDQGEDYRQDDGRVDLQGTAAGDEEVSQSQAKGQGYCGLRIADCGLQTGG